MAKPVSYTHLDVYKRQAFVAYQYKVKIPIVYDMDDMVTSETGQQLYKNDIVWCQRFHIETIADLYNRIVDYSKYQSLWVKRCDFAYNLLTQTSEEERFQIQNRHPDLFLYCLLYTSRCV